MPKGPGEQDKAKFIEHFQNKLFIKLEQEGITMDAVAVRAMAEKFTNALIKFRKEIHDSPDLYKIIKGEIAWSAGRQEKVAAFSRELDDIFKSIGGIKPEKSAAFWSGAGKIRANEFGVVIGETIPGFIINEVETLLLEIFAPHTHKVGGEVDTGVDIGLWEALSQLYSEGTLGDAHIFLINGETSMQSIFWNTELFTLRLQQQKGTVGSIFVHTLTPTAFLEFKSLVQVKNQSEIEKLLKDEGNWQTKPLEACQDMRLKVSGSDADHKTVKLSTIFKIKDSMLETTLIKREIKRDPKKYVEEHYAAPLREISKKIEGDSDVSGCLNQLIKMKKEMRSVLLSRSQAPSVVEVKDTLNRFFKPALKDKMNEAVKKVMQTHPNAKS
jgi:hypothetical protein